MHSFSNPQLTRDPITFLKYAHDIGAAGVQVAIGPRDADYTSKLRATAAEWQMFVEGQGSLPRVESGLDRLDREIAAAKESGATVFRTALLGGRRYETFTSPQQFEEFEKGAWTALQLAEPLFKKQKMRLAVENHKDHLVPELLGLLQRLESEYVGVTLDTGNSIALLEEPHEVVRSLAPVTFSVHLKDMGVEEYEDGFLLSEVPMGTGYLDLKRIIDTIHQAAPQAHFNIEMITREPLKVPCLSEKYWATMSKRRASDLARTIAMVKSNPPKQPLPRVAGLNQEARRKYEDENVRSYVAYWKNVLKL